MTLTITWCKWSPQTALCLRERLLPLLRSCTWRVDGRWVELLCVCLYLTLLSLSAWRKFKIMLFLQSWRLVCVLLDFMALSSWHAILETLHKISPDLFEISDTSWRTQQFSLILLGFCQFLDIVGAGWQCDLESLWVSEHQEKIYIVVYCHVITMGI